MPRHGLPTIGPKRDSITDKGKQPYDRGIVVYCVCLLFYSPGKTVSLWLGGSEVVHGCFPVHNKVRDPKSSLFLFKRGCYLEGKILRSFLSWRKKIPRSSTIPKITILISRMDIIDINKLYMTECFVKGVTRHDNIREVSISSVT